MKISKYIDRAKIQINMMLNKFGYEIKLNGKNESFNLVFNQLIKEKNINLIFELVPTKVLLLIT